MAESSKNSNIFSNKPHKGHAYQIPESTNNPGQTITSSNPFGPFHHQCWWGKSPSQIWINQFQYDFLSDRWNPIIFPTTPYTGSSSTPVLFNGNNLNSMKPLPNENLHPKTSITIESINGKRYFIIPETNLEGVVPLRSVASGSKNSPNEAHDANNINGYTKLLSKRLVTDKKNSQNGSSSADLTQLMNQNLETHIINESGTNSQLENPEDEEERKARKRKAAVISRSKPMMKRKDFPSTKKQQCGVVLGNGEDTQKVTTRMENSDAANQNGSSSAALNPTELNQNLETGINPSTSIVRPEIPEDEEEIKARKRAANRISNKKTRMKKKKEYEEVEKKVANLRDENEELRKELVWLSEKCVDITNENDSLLEEMVDKYGEETIAQHSIHYLDLAYSNI